jgi:class 3 adenylate cyclase
MFDRANLINENLGRSVASDRTPAPRRESTEALLAILVTDLEAFTPLVLRLGDAAAQRVMRVHNRALRDCLGAHAGREIAHTGDGVLAAFRSVARALTCAAEMQFSLRRFSRTHPQTPLRVRIGIHAGEPLPEDGRLFGTCVNTAVRICSVTQAAHVLVSDVVCQLAAGRDFEFHHRGRYALKGLKDPLRLHELCWSAQARS